MREYSYKELEQVCSKADQWFNKFSKSPYFQNLTEGQKEESEFIITILSECMYTYHNRTLEEWGESGLKKCCLETLPRKVITNESYYKSLSPVLSAFINFTEKEGLRQLASLTGKHQPKIGRNDPCSCGSGKKYKKCCGR